MPCYGASRLLPAFPASRAGEADEVGGRPTSLKTLTHRRRWRPANWRGGSRQETAELWTRAEGVEVSKR